MTGHCSVLGSRCLVLKKFQDHTTTSLSGPEILGPHNDIGEIVRSWSGPETPVRPTLTCWATHQPRYIAAYNSVVFT